MSPHILDGEDDMIVADFYIWKLLHMGLKAYDLEMFGTE